MHSNSRVRVGSMLRLPDWYRYVWHHVLFTVSKSYRAEPPRFLVLAVESLWGDDTMKCPLWMTWLRGTEPSRGPVHCGRAGPASGSESESDESCS